MKELIIFCCILFAGLWAEAFIVQGEAVPIGQGQGRAFVDMDRNGQLRSVGIMLSEEAMQGLPEQDHGEYILRLPAILNVPPFNHMVVNWEPHGHIPEGVYNVPHFDFHFYFISEEARAAITCTGDNLAVCLTQPVPDRIPPYYVPTPDGVPQMGWHWIDPRSPEFNGQKFTSTYIYGFYDGKNHFVEPMVTREFLMQKPQFTQSVPVPKELSYKGYLPQSYAVTYDENCKQYFIILKDFVTN